MTYCCEDCGFPFRYTDGMPVCPFCEGRSCRPATEKESEYLRQILNVDISESEQKG